MYTQLSSDLTVGEAYLLWGSCVVYLALVMLGAALYDLIYQSRQVRYAIFAMLTYSCVKKKR